MSEKLLADLEVKVESITGVQQDKLVGLNMTGRTKYYEQGYHGEGIIVAVVDTGILKHLEFEDRILPGVNYCSTGMCSPGTDDDNGHGSHVSGTIAGKNVGIAPKAKILPVKVMDAFGQGNIEDVIKGLTYILNWKDANGNRVDLVNMSLSCPDYAFNPDLLKKYHDVIKALVDSGIAVIVAAGNTGVEQVLYPAFFPEVITVGAVDINKKAALFSTQSKEVDLCQVGVDVFSCSAIPGEYQILSGTSMASPAVCGIAALMLCKYKQRMGKNMSEESLYEALKLSTIDIGVPGLDIVTGAGFCTLTPFNKTVIKIKEGSYQAIVNEVPKTLDVAPISVPPGRVLVPIRFITESMGGAIQYNFTTTEITIEI